MIALMNQMSIHNSYNEICFVELTLGAFQIDHLDSNQT